MKYTFKEELFYTIEASTPEEALSLLRKVAPSAAPVEYRRDDWEDEWHLVAYLNETRSQ